MKLKFILCISFLFAHTVDVALNFKALAVGGCEVGGFAVKEIMFGKFGPAELVVSN